MQEGLQSRCSRYAAISKHRFIKADHASTNRPGLLVVPMSIRPAGPSPSSPDLVGIMQLPVKYQAAKPGG
jgi:hypothetical protein